MILAGDIGGTKTNLALFAADPTRTRPTLIREQTFVSRDHSGLQEIIELFQGTATTPSTLRGACFGVAGPIVEQHSKIPNLPWVIDGPSLQRHFSLPSVALINDLEATAEGIPTLLPDEFATINVGTVPAGALQCGAVISAGTGLGMALLQPTLGQWIPAPSEGGHADFAPRNEIEMALLQFLLTRHKRVSAERVVSGPGLHAVYDFFASRAGAKANPQVAQAVAENNTHAPQEISNAGLSGTCPVCVDALHLFVTAYGSCAGNLGLLALSSGGLFLGGGIATKILPKLKDGTFMAAFCDKGRLTPVLERMPVQIILNQKAPLLGAARRALRNLGAAGR